MEPDIDWELTDSDERNKRTVDIKLVEVEALRRVVEQHTEHTHHLMQELHLALGQHLEETSRTLQAIKRQVDDTTIYGTLQETKFEVLALATITKNLHEQSEEGQGKLNRIFKQSKEIPQQLESLEESIQRSQKQSRSSRQEQPEKVTSSISRFNMGTVAIMLIVQTVLATIATTSVIHQFPPGANVKSQQQWYAIFQRVDRLYKDRHGNKSLTSPP